MQSTLFSPHLSECFTTCNLTDKLPTRNAVLLCPQDTTLSWISFYLPLSNFLFSLSSSSWQRLSHFPGPLEIYPLHKSLRGDILHSNCSKHHLYFHGYKIAISSLVLSTLVLHIQLICCSCLALNMRKSEVSFSKLFCSLFPHFLRKQQCPSPPLQIP